MNKIEHTKAGKTAPSTFRMLLQRELVERCRKNPRYSLRSFAKTLGVSASALSDMLKGKRTITPRTIDRLGFALGLKKTEVERFKATAKPENEIQPAFQQILLDQYALISDWYHYAILELIKIRGVSHESSAIAKILGITKSEVNIAIERLERMALVEKTAVGSLVDTSDGFSTNISGNLTSNASRALQKQILEQAIHALVSLPIEVRNHTSMTMAVDPKLMPEAIEKIKKFRRELCVFLESSSAPKEVYQLSVALFPVTQISKSEGEN